MSDWYRREPGLSRFGEELRRLRTRARAHKHWVRALGIALILTALAVTFEIRKPERYYASITLNMLEGTIKQRTTPVPKSELRTYIADACLNRRHILKVIEQFDLYPRLRAINPELAITEFWSDLEIDVYQNQFAVETDQQFRRSARIGLTFAALDPETAVQVVNELRRIITDFEIRRARQAAEDASDELGAALQAAEDITADHRIKLALKTDEWTVAPPQKEAALQFQVFLLQERVIADARRLDALTKARAQVDLRRNLNNAQSAQLVQIVDQQVPAPHNPRPIKLAILAFAVFFFTFPMAAMGVAAFDSRIYDTNDIRRLGVEVVGNVPAFDGSEVGTLTARRRS